MMATCKEDEESGKRWMIERRSAEKGAMQRQKSTAFDLEIRSRKF